MAFIIPIVVLASFALSVAQLLLRKKPEEASSSVASDDLPTTLSRKGAMLPYLMGQYEVGPYMTWADDEGKYTVEEKIGESGGGKGSMIGGGGSQDITQTVWYSSGWHCICPGPVRSLKYIRDRGTGKKIWEGSINSSTTASGSVIDAGSEGSFEIYWGELNQPISSFLSNKIGVASRWPGVCYVVWRPKRLGQGTTWPDLVYFFENSYACVPSVATPYMLDDGESRGVNPAHVLAQLFSGQYPYGCGLAGRYLDEFSLTELALVCAAEHLPVNILIEEGQTVEGVVQAVMADIGILLTDSPEGCLIFRAVRASEDPIPDLTADVVLAPQVEVAISSSTNRSNRVIYLFRNEKRNYTDEDVPVSDDTGVVDYARYKTSTVRIESATHPNVATAIAARRESEVTGNSSNFKIQTAYGSTLLIPGDSFTHADIGPVLVLAVQRSTTTSEVTLECFLDSYAVVPPSVILNVGVVVSSSSLPPEYDPQMTWFELPSQVSAGRMTIAVLRVRAHPGIVGAIVHLSVASSAYVIAGQQNTPCAGGVLLQDMLLTTEDIVENGPVVETLNTDILGVQDLSSQLSAWQSGAQIAVINGEVFFLRNVAAVAEDEWEPSHAYALGDSVISASLVTGLRYVCIDAGMSSASEPVWPKVVGEEFEDGGVIWQVRRFTYALKGLIRARYSTTQGVHSAGSVAFISNASLLIPISSPLLVPGATACIKTQPYTSGSIMAISGATAVCKPVNGSGSLLTYLATDTGSLLVDNTGLRFTVD